MMRSAQSRSAAFAAAAALVLTASGLALAGCGREHAPESAPPPPPVADQPLAGAPEAPPPPVSPPPPEVQPGEASGMEAPSAAPGIVAMAPIPNPPEAAPRARRLARHSRIHPRFVAERAARRHRAGAMHRGIAHRAAGPVRPAAPAPARPTSAPLLRHAAPTRHGHHGSKAAPNATVGAAGASAGPRAQRIAALQTALGASTANSAVLALPRFTPGTPADVSLTVPAAFAETLRTEAGRQGLADDAASAALTSRLSGDGYVVIPDAGERQVIMAGQPTVFHWTATKQPGARGPLQAQLGAQLLGGGQDQLDLGVVKAGASGGAGWKIVGGVLLALVAALVIALFARSGRARPTVVTRRPTVQQRPFDMGRDDDPRV